MRPLALTATVLISAAAGAAHAQAFLVPYETTPTALNRAAFAPRLASPALSRLLLETPVYEVAASHDWPAVIRLQSRTLGIEVTPHAALGVTELGRSAEAGATLQLSRGQSVNESPQARLRALGLSDGAQFGERGRWYLFAAASGRSVGLNMLHTGADWNAGWNRAGWSQDATSALVGDAQLGVGWRKGPMQTSLGYIHREVKAQNMLRGLDAKGDSMVAFSLTVKPRL